MHKIFLLIYRIPRNIAIFLVKIYQWTLSPWIGQQCRFTPTCSNYSIEAYRKYGFFIGSWKTLWRILRCNPFCKGGDDQP